MTSAGADNDLRFYFRKICFDKVSKIEITFFELRHVLRPDRALAEGARDRKR